MTPRLGLAVLLAFLSAICRCHSGLHHHDDHVHVAMAHGWTHVPVVSDRAEHALGDHHHDLFTHILCDHDDHDCACSPLMTGL
jgi:hypothetical protein